MTGHVQSSYGETSIDSYSYFAGNIVVPNRRLEKTMTVSWMVWDTGPDYPTCLHPGV